MASQGLGFVMTDSVSCVRLMFGDHDLGISDGLPSSEQLISNLGVVGPSSNELRFRHRSVHERDTIEIALCCFSIYEVSELSFRSAPIVC